MRRRLFTFCSTLSLLLCVGLCLVWARSWGATRQFVTVLAGTNSLAVHCTCGEVSIELTTHCDEEYWIIRGEAGAGPRTEVAPSRWSIHLNQVSGLPPRHDRGWRFDRYVAYPGDSGAERVEFRLPAWGMVGLTALPASAWAVGALRRRPRFRSGLCPSCGYDLRATPDRCPECGRATAK